MGRRRIHAAFILYKTLGYPELGYLDVLNLLVGTSYIYFTSDKSNLIELCQWLGKNHWIGNPFNGSVRTEMFRNMNYNASYTDIMLYKKETQIPFKR